VPSCIASAPLLRRLVYHLAVWFLLAFPGLAAIGQASAEAILAHPVEIDNTTIAVIINAADPLSVAAGQYYVRSRHVPAWNVIQVSFPAGASEMPVEAFARVKADVDGATLPSVQAYALMWAAPYRVGCMSITSAFAFGYDRSYCGNGCEATRLSPYFRSESRSPALDLKMRPAMMLAGRGLVEIMALIDRGIKSDGTHPRGTAYLLVTTDKTRDSRVLTYPVVQRMGIERIRVEVLKQDVLTHRDDVMFYFTGLASVAGLDTLHFLPGAAADHLTSFGGMLTDSSQMSALKWLEAGATGSYGTVVEPCNFPQKFSDPAILIGQYVRGETLIEAYWKSVAWPGQGVFIGEPLAAPYKSRRERD
jgi:uncharacterized protein (TIGR03790 family)